MLSSEFPEARPVVQVGSDPQSGGGLFVVADQAVHVVQQSLSLSEVRVPQQIEIKVRRGDDVNPRRDRS
ncbi:MAG: hypothetical protein ACI8P0_005835 [Planctomycetaceae bacterium]|jgi:hypothetical protein